ncbi:MAG TPA: tat (twin-arginine translocation) pathway signal sequence [Porphyromonadaceae bacterium]|nr:tat (twin-arginine translocation) pathway signal sequence [Porphyromonadaceae bacterium]
MKRRDFLKTGAIMGASAAVSLNFDKLQAAINTNTMAVETAPDLVAVMGGEPEAMLDKALETLGGIGNFVKKGQKIVIKPNIGWDRAPELAGNTNPQLIGALVKKCLNAGASKVTVFDHTCDDWKKCYASSGIESAVKAAGGVIVPGNDEKYYSKEISLPNGVNLKSIKVHDALIEADAWINVPVLKNHGGAKLSCAMKNLMGIVWDRRVFHSNDLQQCIADVCTWNKKPVLHIVDSYRILFQNGPQGKSEADVATVKALIASKDIIATDTAALQLFNQVQKLDLEAVKHIQMGQSHKLGTTDLKSVNIKRIKI